MAASTFTVTGTFTQPSGDTVTGTVTFRASNAREVNTNTIQDAVTITANIVAGVLTRAGGAAGQPLVINVGGYTVTENVAGAAPITYTIPGLANIDLSSVDPSQAQFDASDVVNVTPGETVSATTYTWVLGDGANKVKRFTNANPVTTTIDGAAAIPVGWEARGFQGGAGRVTVIGTNGAVIRGVNGAVTSIALGSTIVIRKDTATIFYVGGSVS